jgi:acetylornithine deacetylase/succinyl-diaminopimelate desuccinylase-like protein
MESNMPHPDYERAARHITVDACRRTLTEMVDIASPTGRETDLARYCVERLASSGFAAHLQEVEPGRANAVASRRGSGDGSNLLFTGHMDTSYDGDEPQYQGEGYKAKAVYRDGWIWGLGANNMKSGLASAMVALEAIAREDIRLKGDVVYGGVVGETEKAPVDEYRGPHTSGYGIGSRYLVTHGVTADYAILCEPTGLRVCTANMGVVWMKITLRGTISHSALSAKPGVVNAIDEMHALQAQLRSWIQKCEASGEYLGERPNVTVAAIRGGMPWRLSRNPYECSLYLDVRTVPGQTAEKVKRSLRAELRAFAQERRCDEPSLEVFVTDPPTALDPDAPLTHFMKDAHRRVTGQESPLIMRRTGADSTHFTRYDVPCICYGPGGITHPDLKGALMHAVGEHASVDALVTAAKVYLEAALSICSAKPPGA